MLLMKNRFGRGEVSRVEEKRLIWKKVVVVLGKDYKCLDQDVGSGNGDKLGCGTVRDIVGKGIY